MDVQTICFLLQHWSAFPKKQNGAQRKIPGAEIIAWDKISKTIFVSLKESESEVAQSCPALCNHMDSSVHGILQARILQWVAIPFSRRSSHPGIKPVSPALQADFLLSEPPGTSNIKEE